MAKFVEIQNEKGVFMFDCPGCGCSHAVYTETANSNGAKWQFNGDVNRPTVAPSLLVRYRGAHPPITPDNVEEWSRNPWPQTMVERVCHSYIVDGKIQYLTDCTHHLAGQTIELPDVNR